MTPATAAPDPALHAALLYASLGWRVIPLHNIVGSHCSCRNPKCGSPGKHPRTPNGCTDGSADEAQIRRWWAEHPGANVGICTGLLPDGRYLTVLDNDPSRGGRDSLAALVAQHGALPSTVWCRTGSGGEHHYFESAAPVHNSVDLVAQGLDVRGEGGYVVAPPSNHFTCGVYRWDELGDPQQCLAATLPDWLYNLATRKRQKRPQAVGADAIIEGGRNDHLFKIGAGLRGRGCAESTILTALLAENVDRCKPPLDEAEVKKIAWSAAKYDANAPTVRAAPTVDPATGEVFSNWQDRLERSNKGLANTLGNAVTFLANDDPWRGVLGYDEFADMVCFLKQPPFEADYAGPHRGSPKYPCEVSDEDATRAVVWLERTWHLRVGDGTAQRAIEAVARQTAFHPVRDYLSGLVWDGTPRIATWLVDHLGVPDTVYARSVGQWWLISAVARIFKPGCKVDHVLIFEGKQHLGKSSVLRAIGEPWFADELPDLSDKDSRQQIRGVWIVEVAELDALGRAAVAAAKKFFTQSIDRYRPSFGRRARDYPRQCVFGGTVNEVEYLRDPTGNRRFWPVLVTRVVDLVALRAIRDQLWAEAVCAFKAGQPWWPTDDLEREACEGEQEQRYQVDAWEGQISEWLDKREDKDLAPGAGKHRPVHVGLVLDGALGLKPDKWDRAAQIRAGQVLQRLGWVRGKRTAIRGARVVPWFAPDATREFISGANALPLLTRTFSGAATATNT